MLIFMFSRDWAPFIARGVEFTISPYWFKGIPLLKRTRLKLKTVQVQVMYIHLWILLRSPIPVLLLFLLLLTMMRMIGIPLPMLILEHSDDSQRNIGGKQPWIHACHHPHPGLRGNPPESSSPGTLTDPPAVQAEVWFSLCVSLPSSVYTGSFKNQPNIPEVGVLPTLKSMLLCHRGLPLYLYPCHGLGIVCPPRSLIYLSLSCIIIDLSQPGLFLVEL